MPSMYSSALSPLKQPIAIRPDCVVNEPTTITVQQKPGWTQGDFIAQRADGSTILSSNGKLWSKSARKEFQDASGLPLFSLRRAWLSLARHYWLELPGGGGQEILTVRQRWSFGKIKLDFTLHNAASPDQEEEKVLELRGADMLNEITEVSCDGSNVASIRRKMDPPSYKYLPEYEVGVASGMDTALVSVMVVILAELIHNNWDTKHPRG
ncbi:MAG: hypothetical protein Q9172_004983 [Xanthocarpia lactea]